MSNLPTNPQPQYEEKKEKIISEKSVQINEKKVLSKLLEIIEANRKLEVAHKNEVTSK